MDHISQYTLQEIVKQSRTSPRCRNPMPLHPAEYIGPQALINAVQIASYMRPHMHPDHDEIWIPVQGTFMLGLFDNEGNPK